MQQKKNKQAGYTLIELLTVVTIIGILASIAIPNYKGYRDKAKMVTVNTTLRQIRLAQEVYWTDHKMYFPDPSAPIVDQSGSLTVAGLDMKIYLPHGQKYSIATLDDSTNNKKSYTVVIETDFDRNQNGVNDQYLYTRVVDNSGAVISETDISPLKPVTGT